MHCVHDRTRKPYTSSSAVSAGARAKSDAWDSMDQCGDGVARMCEKSCGVKGSPSSSAPYIVCRQHVCELYEKVRVPDLRKAAQPGLQRHRPGSGHGQRLRECAEPDAGAVLDDRVRRDGEKHVDGPRAVHAKLTATSANSALATGWGGEGGHLLTGDDEHAPRSAVDHHGTAHEREHEHAVRHVADLDCGERGRAAQVDDAVREAGDREIGSGRAGFGGREGNECEAGIRAVGEDEVCGRRRGRCGGGRLADYCRRRWILAR